MEAAYPLIMRGSRGARHKGCFYPCVIVAPHKRALVVRAGNQVERIYHASLTALESCYLKLNTRLSRLNGCKPTAGLCRSSICHVRMCASAETPLAMVAASRRLPLAFISELFHWEAAVSAVIKVLLRPQRTRKEKK